MALDTTHRDGVTERHALSGARPSECGSHSGPRWYVAQTHRGAERLAVEELANQNFATLLPLRRRDPRPVDPSAPRQHRKRDDGPPYTAAFPGYLFVLFDITADPWRCIHSTRGVKRLFSISEDRPVPVPVGVVERLMARLSKGLVMHLPTEPGEMIPDGALVSVLSGPFLGQQGVCLRSDIRAGTVRLRLLTSAWDVDIARAEVGLAA